MNLSLSETELPVRLRFDRPMTGEELMRFSSENEPVKVEREPNGELIVMSPSGSEDGSAEADILVDLGTWARRDGRGRVFSSSAGFTLPDTSVRAADAAWMSWGRRNALPREQHKGFAPVCPEFVIEVRSETDRLAALEAKMARWIGNGAELAWLIDPKRRAVAVYRPGDESEVHQDPSSVQGTGPVAAFELVMAGIWG
jgi:Uma2 family endonuclease